MTRKIAAITSVFILGACSISCSDRFESANNHIIDTVQIVYELKGHEKINNDNALIYQNQIDNAFDYIKNGSALCESDENMAKASFDKAESLLNEIDNTLRASKPQALTEEEGK